MHYTVLVTFDLKGASSTDYTNAYNGLEELGLSKVQQGSKGEVVIPTTTVLGKYNGDSSSQVRNDVREWVRRLFKSLDLESEIFVVVGEKGTWGSIAT